MKIEINMDNGTLRTVENKTNDAGQFTLQKHLGKVIGPKDDLTEVEEPLKGLAEVVRANYIEPIPEATE